MNLRPSHDQRMIIEAARGFLQRAVPPAKVNELDASDAGFDPALWREMSNLGWTSMALPETHGGLGSIVDLCLVAEENGRVALTSPLLSTVAARALPIALGGSDDQRDRWLRGLLAGETIATMALLDPESGSEWSPVHLRGERSGEGWTLTGAKVLVPWANVVDLLLASVDLEAHGPAFVLVPTATDGLTITPNAILGSDRRFRVELKDVAVGEEDVLPAPDGFEAARASSLDAQSVLSIALAVGLCDQALSMSVQYACERHQFGRPIGSFQAIAYRCVDMKIAIDACRLFCHKAAWHLDVGRPANLHVGAAKAYANEMIEICTHNAHQVHGAIGFSTEYDLHLFTRRARAFASNHGTTARSLERVATGLGLDQAPVLTTAGG